MVLQRLQPVPIWGWTEPGQVVTVRFAGQEKQVAARPNGSWEVQLDPLDASAQPRDLVVDGDTSVTLTNILVGEVWLCSGQSNMEKPIGEQRGQKPVFHAEQELADADSHPEIRLFKTQKTRATSPATNVAGAWCVCSSNALETTKFSAAGYFFGRKLLAELKVPIGLIDSTWGGTRIEPWTPLAGFEQVPSVAEYADAANPTNRSIGVSRLFNGMIAPLVPFAIRGALWYQGESNLIDVNDGLIYADKMKALVLGWRRVWRREFPFFYVQIAPYRYHRDRSTRVKSDESLPEFWEAQTLALRIPDTGMVVTTDLVDNLHDIHPRNKQEVGNRLARLALARVYDRKNVAWSGPLYRSMEIRGTKIVLHFDHTEGGLISKDGKPLTWFTIAGADGRFEPAEAAIEGRTVVVSNPEIKAPRAVRFAWDEIAEPNLFNGAGLPAVPFRTGGPK